MNYLAHAYLSFGNKEILMGNMISDFVKGKQQYTYPDMIHKGIVFHRAIDDFTDAHAVTREAKKVFHKDYRLYSGAFMDVAYDHYLACDHEEFPGTTLYTFSQKTYASLSSMQEWMPLRFRNMFYYMQSQNWLYGYRNKKEIYQSFGGLVQRAAYLHDSKPAIIVFNQHYYFLQECYRKFWKDLKLFASEKYNRLMQRKQ